MSFEPTNIPTSGPAGATDPALPAPTHASANRARAYGAIGVGVGLVIGLVIGLVVVPAIGSVAGGIITAAQPSPIAAATETCGVESSPYIVVGDEGQSVSMDSVGEESAGAEYPDILCVLNELDVPDSVLNRINSTRALDGRQTAEWDNFTASWGYHPNSGANIIIEGAS